MRRAIPPAPILALAIGCTLVCAYAWVLDDAFVYFRYADNATLLDAGLVFNQGEYVEGYTSPLWMLLLVAARAVHLHYWPVILTTGLAAMVVTWLLAIRVNRRLSGEGVVEFHLPALWLASCYAVQSHFTSGLETPLVQVFALGFAALILEPEVAWLQVLVGLGPLVRPELNLAFVIAVAWCWHQGGRVPWKLVGAGLLTQSAWLSFRLGYYADFLPNTFHLKDTAATARGLHYLHDTLRAYYLYWVLGGLFVLLGVALRAPGGRALRVGPRAILWLAATAHAAYVVRIGGDFVHYRYLAFPVLVLIASLGGVVEQFLGPPSRHGARAALGLGVGFIGLIVLAYPAAQLPAHPLLLRPRADALVMYRVDGVEDAAAHRGRTDLAPQGWDGGTGAATALRRNGRLTYHWAASSPWCRDAYAHLGWFEVQSLGLTEPVLAHMVDPFPLSQAGHRWGVVPLAQDLVRVRMGGLGSLDGPPPALRDVDDSVYLGAVRRGEAAPWIVRNIGALDAIEHRTHRPRAPWSNVMQAFRAWPTISVSRRDVGIAARRQR